MYNKQNEFKDLFNLSLKKDKYGYSLPEIKEILIDFEELDKNINNLYNLVKHNKVDYIPNYISGESFITVFETLINTIKEFIIKISYKLKEVYQNVSLRIKYYGNYFNSITKKLSSIRNKNKLLISSKTREFMFINFNIEKEQDLLYFNTKLNRLLENYKKSVNDVINSYSIDNRLIFTNLKNEEYIKSNENGILRIVGPNDDIKHYYKPTTNNTKTFELDYNLVLSVSEIVDDILSDITKLTNQTNEVNIEIRQEINKIEANKTFDKNNENKLKNLLFLQKNYPSKILKSYNNSINKIKTFLTMVYNDSIATSKLIYTDFLNKVKTDKNYVIKKNLEDIIGDPNSLSLVDDGKYLYIELGYDNFINNKLEDSALTISGSHIVDRIDTRDNTTKGPLHIQDPKVLEEGFVYSGIENSGIILLCKEAILNDLKKYGGKVTFDYIYYHEVGHLITKQERKVYFRNKYDFMDTETNPIEMYINNEKENKSDAYACLITGISPEDVWDYRLKLFNINIELYNKAEPYEYDEDLPKSKYDKWIEEVKTTKKDTYINNVKKHMKEMMFYVKLGPKGWVRSLLTRIKD